MVEYTCIIFIPFAGSSYRASHFIQPKLSQSQLSFKDLHMDPDTGKVFKHTLAAFTNILCITKKLLFYN